MQDNYYNHMLSVVIRQLREFKPIYDKDMVEFQTMPQKDWNSIEGYIDPLNEYDNGGRKRSRLMEYFSSSLYPILKTIELKKFGFKKLMSIRIDSFDLRMILDKLESLMI